MEQGQRSRMSTEERREQLLRAGADLLATRSHEEVSIEEIAAAAGVSTGLLYHYFPTKQEFILAALQRGQNELIELLAPDPGLDPMAQFEASLDAFLDYVEEHATAYEALVSGSAGDAEIAAARRTGRALYMQTLIGGLGRREGSALADEPSLPLKAALQGWLFFVDGVVLCWLEEGGMERAQVREILRSGLGGALRAAQAGGARLKI